MHKIAAKEFTLEDFSHEHLLDVEGEAIEFDNAPGDYWNSMALLDITVRMLNMYRQLYLETKDKKYWWQMIQLLPSSYNQRRTVMLNYEVLANIYKSRKGHRLDEWREHGTVFAETENGPESYTEEGFGFCDWIKTLPYSELITGPSLKDIPICHEIMEEAKKRVKQNQRCSEEVLKKVEQRIRMREESKEFFTKLREEAEKEGIR